MIYDDKKIHLIGVYFLNFSIFSINKFKYNEYEGSLRGADINMLINRCLGILNILKKKLDLKKKNKLNDLIKRYLR
ncbi:MAG: hypothetical protein CM15mP108_1050 [Gammaproteobacteria bacterium]|nr:MAG: hypothetical protein CM15mP108_1050 [Gammaproteobacteria bacterium]